MHLSYFKKKLFKQRKFRQLIVGSILFSLSFGVLIVPLERIAPHATIQTMGDGLWWSFQTLTTVGYGDVTPVTPLGRTVGVIMQIVGAVLFGALVALISNTMSRRQEEFYWDRLFERLDAMNARMDKIEQEVQYMIKDKPPMKKE